MRIMTSNIWGDYFGNPVSVRQDGLLTVFKRYSPQVLGLQEATRSWYESPLLNGELTDYRAVASGDGEFRNYVPLLFRRELELHAHGYEYMLHCDDRSKGISWAVLSDREARRLFAVCNTHFWYPETREAELVREKNALQLATLMEYIRSKYGCAVFAFGDMNCTVASGAFRVLAEHGIRSLREEAEVKSNVSSYHYDPILGEDGSYHGTPAEMDFRHSLDHIVALGDGFRVREYRVVEDRESIDATDHSPVFVDIEFV